MEKLFDDIRWDRDVEVCRYVKRQTVATKYEENEMSLFAVAAYYGSINSLKKNAVTKNETEY